MSDLQILLLVLGVLYLLQCVSWLPGGSFAFQTLWNTRWKLVQAEMYSGASERRPILVNPLPPLGGLLVCQSLPVCLSLDGACYPAAFPFRSARDSSESSSHLRFGDIRRVASAGKVVQIGDKPFIKTHSEIYARHLAGLLGQLQRCPPAQRDATIELELARMLDSDQVAQRFAEYCQQSLPLRVSCNVLFLFLALVIPATLWYRGLLMTWPYLLLYLILHLSLTAFCFRRAHRALYPEEKENRLTLVATILLSPPVAVRANDLLTRDVLCAFHPLAVARVLCADEQFLALASRALRETQFPLPTSIAEDETTRQLEEAYREKLCRTLRRFIAATGTDPEKLLGPPARDSEESRSYCPRCWNQYVVPSGVCQDCKGLPLRSFSGKRVA